MIKSYSDSWIIENLNGNASVEEIIPVSNYQQIIGYCVEFIQGNEPAGYIIIDVESGKAVVTEFALTGESPYDTISEKAGKCKHLEAGQGIGTKGATVENERVLYTEDKFNYGITVEKDITKDYKKSSTVYLNSEEIIEVNISKNNSTQMRGTPSDNNFYDGIITGLPHNKITTNSVTALEGFTPRLQSSFLKNGESPNNCSPANFTNMLMYCGIEGIQKLIVIPIQFIEKLLSCQAMM